VSPQSQGKHQENKQEMLQILQGEKGALIHYWWGCKLVQPVWKRVWRFLKKLKPELAYDPAIPLLGTYVKERKSAYNSNTCTFVF
jgi:hypothetical protein